MITFHSLEDRIVKTFLAVRAGRTPSGSRHAPPRAETRLLLARAATPEQEVRIGDQTGGRVFLFLETDGFERDYRAMTERGVRFRESPRQEDYGIVAVFEDLYGNLWDLIEPL